MSPHVITQVLNVCCSDAEEELRIYRDSWDRHYDIMMEQESESEELLRDLGCDIVALHVALSLRSTAESVNDSNSRWAADEAIAKRNQLISLGSSSSEELDIEFGDEKFEAAEATIKQMEHPVVRACANKADVLRTAYPREFLRTVPECLLKGLYYYSDQRYVTCYDLDVLNSYGL
jgi:hypothetical protein